MNCKALLLLLLLSGFPVKGQVKDFIGQFKMTQLPYCSNYSEEEKVYFGSEFYVDSTLVEEVDTTYWDYEEIYIENTTQKPDSLLIDTTLVKQCLLPPEVNFDSDSESIYAVNLVIATKRYYGVVYERIFVNSMDSSEKYFCTFSPKGKFISRVMVGSYIYSGTGTGTSGARIPWFPEKKGCIEKDLTIKVFDHAFAGDRKYKINTKGKIIEIKY